MCSFRLGEEAYNSEAKFEILIVTACDQGRQARFH